MAWVISRSMQTGRKFEKHRKPNVTGEQNVSASECLGSRRQLLTRPSKAVCDFSALPHPKPEHFQVPMHAPLWDEDLICRISTITLVLPWRKVGARTLLKF
ncbi:hypothetical protein ZHAS_00004363 [Anopheles sinensis]|uniref:Uncharacterized protein n=1 Tax=Anopheles sinensis TaxID=74873 RepID=A0A084VGR2_ANOSI|nr:hypothetical protein ZHAS_00004363 [Anopheles sinensis]